MTFWILIALIVAVSIPIFVLLSLATHRKQKKLTEQNFMGQAAKASALHETMANALTVKSLGLESEIERRWDHRLGLSAWTGYRSHSLSGGAPVCQKTSIGIPPRGYQ